MINLSFIINLLRTSNNNIQLHSHGRKWEGQHVSLIDLLHAEFLIFHLRRDFQSRGVKVSDDRLLLKLSVSSIFRI